MRHKTSLAMTVQVGDNSLTRYFNVREVLEGKDFISWAIFLPEQELDMLAELCESVAKRADGGRVE